MVLTLITEHSKIFTEMNSPEGQVESSQLQEEGESARQRPSTMGTHTVKGLLRSSSLKQLGLFLSPKLTRRTERERSSEEFSEVDSSPISPSPSKLPEISQQQQQQPTDLTRTPLPEVTLQNGAQLLMNRKKGRSISFSTHSERTIPPPLDLSAVKQPIQIEEEKQKIGKHLEMERGKEANTEVSQEQKKLPSNTENTFSAEFDETRKSSRHQSRHLREQSKEKRDKTEKKLKKERERERERERVCGCVMSS